MDIPGGLVTNIYSAGGMSAVVPAPNHHCGPQEGGHVSTTNAAWAIPDWDGKRFQAALFDLDGVLTPTAEVHMLAWHRMFTDYFTAHGVTPEYTDDDYFAHVDGRPRYEGVQECLASRGVELPYG